MINCDEMGGLSEGDPGLKQISTALQLLDSQLQPASKEIALTSDNGVIYAFRNYTLPIISDLEKLIALAGEDPGACNFGGGLPPAELINAFHEIKTSAQAESKYWSTPEIQDVNQYPLAGGALNHRNTVLNRFLGEKEREMIQNNFLESDPRLGLFFTYGSQEGLEMAGKFLVKMEKATPENPIEIAITTPVYPGFLMALKEFLDEGLIKFRLVRVSEKGEINLTDLRDALLNDHCKAFYISEGNPVPVRFSNLREVADLLSYPLFADKITFEDRAYKDLGASEESLVTMVDSTHPVIAFETWSKKGAPFRFGVAYSNLDSDNFPYISKNILQYQYLSKLGYSGEISGTVHAILDNPYTFPQFLDHIQNVQEYYENKRQLYVKYYREAFDLAYGIGNYRLEDKIAVGNKLFMFGWRKIPVPADIYSFAGKIIGIFSVPGTGCKPKREQVVGDYDEMDDSLYRLRQNYTYMSTLAMERGIYKDVLLEILFSDIEPEVKNNMLNRILDKLIDLNEDKLIEISKLKYIFLHPPTD